MYRHGIFVSLLSYYNTEIPGHHGKTTPTKNHHMQHPQEPIPPNQNTIVQTQFYFRYDSTKFLATLASS